MWECPECEQELVILDHIDLAALVEWAKCPDCGWEGTVQESEWVVTSKPLVYEGEEETYEQ